MLAFRTSTQEEELKVSAYVVHMLRIFVIIEARWECEQGTMQLLPPASSFQVFKCLMVFKYSARANVLSHSPSLYRDEPGTTVSYVAVNHHLVKLPCFVFVCTKNISALFHTCHCVSLSYCWVTLVSSQLVKQVCHSRDSDPKGDNSTSSCS